MAEINFDMEAYKALKQNRILSDSDIADRFGYHKATDVTAPRHQATRTKFMALALFLDEILPPGSTKAMAITELEKAAMWANKAIAEMAPVVVETPGVWNG